MPIIAPARKLSTLWGLRRADCLRAVRATSEVDAQLGYTYPEELDRPVTDYVKQMRTMGREG